MGKGIVNIVVIGAGAAGMSAALKAVELGASVTLIARAAPYRSGTACVREGISVAMKSVQADSATLHAEDTLACGEYMSNPTAVHGMCTEAPVIAETLSRLGLVFDRTVDGLPLLERAAGARFARTIRSGRSTGQRIAAVLASQVLRGQATGRLTAHFGWEFLSLIQDDSGRTCGVVAQELRNMEIKSFAADAVILCTGGYSAIFGRHCSSSCNDGAAMVSCWEQGAAIADPEFVQVTPLAISAGGKVRSIPSSVLTLGGSICVERDGKPWAFLKDWHESNGGAVPDDIALASLSKACKEAGVVKFASRLDVAHVDIEDMAENMPWLLDACYTAKIDPSRDPIELAPAVKNTLGGLWVRSDHSTSVQGLFAAGGVSSLYHGACALSGNELLAAVYGGMVAAKSAVASARGLRNVTLDLPASLATHAVERESDLVSKISTKQGTENVYVIAAELSVVLFDKALVEKENEQLARVAGKISELTDKLSRAQLIDRSEWSNHELNFHRRLSRMLTLAEIYCAASIGREESRGVHRKSGLENRDDKKWRVRTKVVCKNAKPAFDYSEKAEGAVGERRY